MTLQKPLILPFSEIRAADLPLVGGKGANLGEMTHAGFPVPPGFCLTTAAFQQFIDACPDAPGLYASLNTVKPDDVAAARQVGRQVRQRLLSLPVPEAVARAVRQACQQLGVDRAYAVRSSATAEDLPDASFAGQQDTYLNIIGADALLDAVCRCWVSLFTDRAILYRSKNQFSHEEVQLSVVVQQMVMAEKSGILFTADPLTGHRHTAVIDASFGLGEALVSGIVSPDSYRVDKRERTLIERQIADKRIAIYPAADGGTRQETLSAAQRSQTVLTSAQILALVEMGIRAEAYFGAPQDMEWAVSAGQIYLLQTRPITSLYPIDGLQSPDGTLHIYFSAGHQQMMTRAMVPLSLSSMKVFVPVGHGQGAIESIYIHASGGRIFGDLTPLLRHSISRKIVFGILSQFEALAPQALQLAMQRPEFQRRGRLSISFAMLRGAMHLVYRVFAALWWQDLTGVVQDVNEIIAQNIRHARSELESVPAGKAKIQAMIALMSAQLLVVIRWVPYFVAGEAAKRLMARVGRRWADPAALEAMSLGLPGNVVTEMNLAVGDLADAARQSPRLAASLATLGHDSEAWLAQARQIADSGPFFQAWDRFMARYGSRGPAEIDLGALRWYEEPLPLLQVIAGALPQEPGSHRAQHQKLVEARETAVAQLIAQADHGLLGRLRQKVVRRLTYVVQYGGALREHHKFMMVQLMRIIKEQLRETAVLLTRRHNLADADDIWFLSWPELLAIWDDRESKFAQKIPGRRVDFKRYQKLTPPMVITSDGETPIVQYQVADAPPGALIGNPVSPGVVEGLVHVIDDPQKETLQPGEILVAPFTDPGWTPLFINAGGLIMEVGGNLTHGSVVAREYGIPAVVGVREATKRLRSGQTVRIDGNRGIIEIL
ncbi:MAG: phosphoenolpyruvate synthase [Candidatus Promineifilaceae bacterium]|nr:phosphoenolpyruvate synthase [Candidatus Promineifilaceae bacterium]